MEVLKPTVIYTLNCSYDSTVSSLNTVYSSSIGRNSISPTHSRLSGHIGPMYKDS